MSSSVSRHGPRRSSISSSPHYRIMLLSNLATGSGASTTLQLLQSTGEMKQFLFNRRDILRSIMITPLLPQTTSTPISLEIIPATLGKIPLTTSDLSTFTTPGMTQHVHYVPYADYTLVVTTPDGTTLAPNAFQVTVVLENLAAYKANIEPRLPLSQGIEKLIKTLLTETDSRRKSDKYCGPDYDEQDYS